MNNLNKKKIAQIGSGFVGLAAGKGFAGKGHGIFFYDVKPEVIRKLQMEGFRADHIENLSKMKNKDLDFILISVPTPTIEGKVSLKFLEDTLQDLGKYLQKAKNFPVFVVRSTVLPGTTEELVIPALEKISGKKYGIDFGVGMNPEFLREARAEEDFANPWMTVIGANDKKTGDLLMELYRPFDGPITPMSIKEAEMTKYAHNLLNATKISFFNEMRIVNERMGIDSDLEFRTVVKSAEAIWNPEYGIKNFGPYGGSCLPKDTSGFFTWTMEKFNLELPVLKGTIQTNEIIKKSRLPMCIEQECRALRIMTIAKQ